MSFITILQQFPDVQNAYQQLSIDSNYWHNEAVLGTAALIFFIVRWMEWVATIYYKKSIWSFGCLDSMGQVRTVMCSFDNGNVGIGHLHANINKAVFFTLRETITISRFLFNLWLNFQLSNWKITCHNISYYYMSFCVTMGWKMGNGVN